MKPLTRLLPAAVLILIISGCEFHTGAATAPDYSIPVSPGAESLSAGDNSLPAENNSVSASLSSPPSDTSTPISAPSAVGDNTRSVDQTVDVDLTAFSSTMVFAEVSQMMTSPEEYLGKTIKMRGIAASSEDPASGKCYYACIVQDATACCTRGIEYVLAGNPGRPEDYPTPGETVCVVGEFEIYEENGAKYGTLKNARIL